MTVGADILAAVASVGVDILNTNTASPRPAGFRREIVFSPEHEVRITRVLLKRKVLGDGDNIELLVSSR
jgi:hypothetical protein